MFNYQEMHHEKQSKPEVVIYWVTTNQIKRRARFNILQRVKEILRDTFILYIYIVCASYVQLSTLVLNCEWVLLDNPCFREEQVQFGLQ